jgi:hypothetical protein
MVLVSHDVALMGVDGVVETLMAPPSGELSEMGTIPPTTVAVGAEIVTIGAVVSTTTDTSAIRSPG